MSDIQTAHFPVIILRKNLVNLVRGSVDVRHGGVVVHEIYDRRDELTHVSLYVIGLLPEFGGLIAEVCGHNPVKIAALVGGVKGGEPVREQPESTADEDTLGIHFL